MKPNIDKLQTENINKVKSAMLQRIKNYQKNKSATNNSSKNNNNEKSNSEEDFNESLKCLNDLVKRNKEKKKKKIIKKC